MSYDDALGLVYAPTGNSTPDFFGAHRIGRVREIFQLDRGARRHRRLGALEFPDRASRHLGLRHAVATDARRLAAGGRQRRARAGRSRPSAASCSCWIDAPARRSPTSKSARCRKAPSSTSGSRRRSRSRSACRASGPTSAKPTCGASRRSTRCGVAASSARCATKATSRRRRWKARSCFRATPAASTGAASLSTKTTSCWSPRR